MIEARLRDWSTADDVIATVLSDWLKASLLKFRAFFSFLAGLVLPLCRLPGLPGAAAAAGLAEAVEGSKSKGKVKTGK